MEGADAKANCLLSGCAKGMPTGIAFKRLAIEDQQFANLSPGLARTYFVQSSHRWTGARKRVVSRQEWGKGIDCPKTFARFSSRKLDDCNHDASQGCRKVP